MVAGGGSLVRRSGLTPEDVPADLLKWLNGKLERTEACYKQPFVPSASQAFTAWGRRTAADARAPSAST